MGVDTQLPWPVHFHPATPGPAPSATANPGPDITPVALAPNGPAQNVSLPQCPVALHLGMAAPAHSAATNTLVAKASSTAEHIAQTADLLTYIRSTQKLTVVAPLLALGHPVTAFLEDYAANGFQVEVG